MGTGYVGLVSAAGLADFGNYVVGVDLNASLVERLNSSVPTIYEPGIDEYLRRNVESRRLRFTTDAEQAIRETEVIMVAVGTPIGSGGEADISQVLRVAELVADNANGEKVWVTKSTVPVGTNRRISRMFEERVKKYRVEVVANPEFLREGRAVHDFFHPDRIVIGCVTARAKEVMLDIYRTLYLIERPFVWCDYETAELIKYACNSFLAMKVTFINQIANLAEAAGADIHVVAKAMGMDGRISPKFLHPGPGYGGSCFPKDTRTLVSIGEAYGVSLSLVKETIAANEKQKKRIVQKTMNMVGTLTGKTIAILGLAFKSETDDVRESPAVDIVRMLMQAGARIRAHDPKAIANFMALCSLIPGEIEFFNSVFEAVTGANAILLITEWNEYRNMDVGRLKDLVADRIILDTRNILDAEEVKKHGFRYEGVGRK